MSNFLKAAIGIILAISLAAFGFLIWLIYFKEKSGSYAEAVAHLPALNALLNSLSTVCLIGGIMAIKKGLKQRHMKWMFSAFIFSTLFLMSYITYHNFHGDSHFAKTGLIRPLYFFVLISHISLTIIALPLILITFFLALTQHFPYHKKIARITFPIWLYISITGVLIYLFNL